ncbi:MAG TPA: NAD-binding protein [Actinomycetota bacterium]|nr:NAD-binding protein [Actinomycetota bacterium]
MLGAVLVYGTVGYMVLEDWNFVDSLYMTVITLTTVGFLEVQPLDTGGRLFTISLLILGVTLVIVTLTLAAGSIAEGGLGERTRRRRMERRIAALKQHFVICAYGRVGRTVARELEAEGQPFVVIDRDDELEDDLLQDGVVYVIGDPTSETVLRNAGIYKAKGLVCAVDDDADNVFITLAARSLNPDLFIVARASETTSADRLYRAGADRVVSPYATSGRQMALLVTKPRVVDYIDLVAREMTPLRIEEILVEAQSDLEGRRLGDAAAANVVVAVRRDDGELIRNPEPDLILQAGDLLVLLGEKEALRAMEQPSRAVRAARAARAGRR